MQQPIGEQIGQQQTTMVQSQPQLVQQQHIVQQQQMMQPQQQILQQQPQMLQQQQILQPQQQILQPQQQILQGQQQMVQGQQQMVQGQQQIVHQMMPQQLGQQMMYCPTVRLVYDTPVLMQGDQMQQQNQGLFVNQPPWARPVQNQVIYVQQIGSNLVPVQHLDPNIYLHQNVPMYQQVVQNVPQLVQNLPQNIQQVRPMVSNIPGLIQNFSANVQNVQDQNVAQLQNIGFVQANQNVNNSNVNVISNEERKVASPMNQQNAQNHDMNQVYRQIVTQVPQIRPMIQMTNQVQNIQNSIQIGQQISGNIGQNATSNIRQVNNSMAQNVQTSSGQHVRQITAQIPPSSMQATNQNVRIVSSNAGTNVTNTAQNNNNNMQQVRHIMPQAVNFTPRGIPQQNIINTSVQNANAISTSGNQSTVTYSAVRNGQPYTYRAIQPKPNTNIRNYTPRPQVQMVRKTAPNLIQSNVPNVSMANSAPTSIKTEAESPGFNKKRKSESPDEVHKKVSNYGSVTVTSQVKDKLKSKNSVHTSEIGVNTSPVHKPKVPVDNQNQPLLHVYPMEAKVKQEFHKSADVVNPTPIVPMRPTFVIKTEAPVDGVLQQTLSQHNHPSEWYYKEYLTDRKHDPKQPEQTASPHNIQAKVQQIQQAVSQQSQHPTNQQITSQPISSQQSLNQNPTSQQNMTNQQLPSQQTLNQTTSPQIAPQPITNPQIISQQTINSPMISQQITHPQMLSQQTINPQIPIQQTTIPQMTTQLTTNPQAINQQNTSHQTTSQKMPSQPTTTQQITSQHSLSKQILNQQAIKKDMSQQTEEKLVRKTVFPQATTRGRLLEDKQTLIPPKIEEQKTIIVSNNIVNTQLPNAISNFTIAPKSDNAHIPIKPIESHKKLEEKSSKTDEPKYSPLTSVKTDEIPKVAPTKNEIIRKTEPNSENKKETKPVTQMTTISDSLKEIIRDTIAKKEDIKTDTNKINPVKPIKMAKETKVSEVKADSRVKTETAAPVIQTELSKSVESIEKVIKVAEAKLSTDFEKVIKDNKIEKKEYKNISINEMTGKEIHIVDGSIRKEEREKDYILTHVLDGYVIQESNVPFAIRRPLKEKMVNAVGEEKEKQDPSMKNLTKEEMKDKILELSQLHIEDGKERRESEKKNDTNTIAKENDENKVQEGAAENVEQRDAANPFSGLDQNVVKTWTVEDLTSHLTKHSWTETVSLLQEHEIDGESLFLVTKNQLVTIGLNEAHAEIICDFVSGKN